MIESVEGWRWGLFALLAAAAVGDIRALRIPNALPLAILALLAVGLVANGAPIGDYRSAALSGLIGLAVGYVFFAVGLMGGGDGKLFAASAAWFPAGALLGVGLLVSIAGVLVAVAALAARAVGRMSTTAQGGAIKAALKTKVPYGVAIAIGVIVAAHLSSLG